MTPIPAVVTASRYKDLPEIEVDNFRAAILWAWWRRHVHLVCASPQDAKRCRSLLRGRLGRSDADELVRITVRGVA